jgi:hypothetical protein
MAQRRGFREYLGAADATGAEDADGPGGGGAGDRVQAAGGAAATVLLAESVWKPEAVNSRRLELLRAVI